VTDEALEGRDLQKILAALASPIRREIMASIWDRQLRAGEIAAAFDVTAPTISQHLGVLRDAGLVTCTVAGTSRHYRARKDVMRDLYGALPDSVRWTPADDITETEASSAQRKFVVVANVDVETDQQTTFDAFTDGAVYSRWLGVPVRIRDGQFACTMEWGTRVRGRYEVVAPPDLIAMRWDFEDDNVPLPGREMTGYLRLSRAPGRRARTHVEVHQMVDTLEQAAFMDAAWRLVLGRLKNGVVAASNPDAAVAARPPRPKRRRSA
jgi:DNA-binding transcriptional ArsR family regulator/uncharacterized protein YndB with AHSA1/START domain